MAFAFTITDIENKGSLKFTYGTYTSSGSGTGGAIDTGLDVCHGIHLQAKATATGANMNVVNATFPVAGNSITIVTTADEVGYWEAFGR